MFRNKWLRPLNVSIVVGVVLGSVLSANPIREQNYLGYHIFNTADSVFVQKLNTAVLFSTLILYAYWIVSWIQRHTRGYARGVVCAAGYGLATVGTILAGQAFYGIYDVLVYEALLRRSKWIRCAASIIGDVRWLVNPNAVMADLRDSAVPLLLALAVLVAGGVLLNRLGNRQADEPSVEAASHADARSIERPTSSGIHLFGFITIAAFGLLACANLLDGFFLVKARLDTRDKPNVIIIALDTTRADHLGCYGYYRNTSPNIDELASNSIRFEHAYSQAPWTTASFSSIMTSEYPATLRSGSVFIPRPIDLDRLTLAKFLQGRGYATGAAVSNTFFSSLFNADIGFDFFKYTQKKEDSSSPGVLDAAKGLLAKMRNRKFCLFLLFIDPHAPYVNRSPYIFMKGLNRQYMLTLDDCEPRKQPRPHIEALKASYDSSIAYTDHYVGLFIKELKKQNLYDNSLIIFLADHGEEFEDHGALFHARTLYNELLHVPLLIKLPGQKQGRVITTDFPLINVYPSVMKMLGYTMPKFDPEGVAVDLENADSHLPNYEIFAQDEGVFDNGKRPIDLTSVQSSGYKYILDLKTRGEQLFDLAADSTEQHNLANDRPALASRFRSLVVARTEEFVKRGAANGASQPSPEFNEAEKKQIRSLGYAN